MKELAKRGLPLVTLLFSAVWIYVGLVQYGFWDSRRGPLGGFFPVLVASVMLLTSVIAILQTNREKMPNFRRESLLLIATVLLVFAACFIVGMLPALALFLVLWLRLLEKYPWKTTVIVSSTIMLLVIAVFSLWLGVMFPQGILLDALAGR